MTEAKLENTIKVTQYNTLKRPNSAMNKVKILSKSLKSKVFPLSRSLQKLKLQRFHAHSINIKSIIKNSPEDLELTTNKIVYSQFPQPTLKKQSFSLQSIPEKGKFLNIFEGKNINKQEILTVNKTLRPSTARIRGNEAIDDNKSIINKFLPKRGKECVDEMLKIWKNDRRQHIFTDESDEDMAQKELLLRISDIDYYIKSENKGQINPLFKTSLFTTGYLKNTSKESFANFGLSATQKPLTQRFIKASNKIKR